MTRNPSDEVDEDDLCYLISSGRHQTILSVTTDLVGPSHSSTMQSQSDQTNVFSRPSSTCIVSGATLSYPSIVIDTNADL